MKTTCHFIACLILVLALAIPAAAQKPCATTTVAAASDLEFAMNEIVAGYQKQTGCMVLVSTGSSGNFETQIENGAPFDVFFSADMEYPRKLESEGLIDPGSTYRYAVGKIVLWTRKETQVDVAKGFAILSDPAVHKIAIANPEHAPYGRAAEQALKKAGVYDAIKDRLVLGENISQTAQFAETGNADVGVLALSLAVSPALKDKGRYWQIPENLYAPMDQGVAIIRASKSQEAARAFLAFVKSPATVAVLARYGFAIPGKAKP